MSEPMAGQRWKHRYTDEIVTVEEVRQGRVWYRTDGGRLVPADLEHFTDGVMVPPAGYSMSERHRCPTCGWKDAEVDLARRLTEIEAENKRLCNAVESEYYRGFEDGRAVRALGG